ncbi:MAG: hypothetical protein M1829_001629 [Trizodia sp. TS-e1964]|nr:MAG: hypothetical protein M1829_001629 [Trizodia sp. TS-e1964]
MSSNNIMSSPTISSPPSGFASRDALPNSQQQGSQAQGKEVVDSSQITFRFCRECSNMLYPKEDRTMPGTLVFQCRTCLFSEKARSNCIFRNVLNNADFETAGVVQDVATDTTVGLPDFCTLCGQQILCITCGDMVISPSGCFSGHSEQEHSTLVHFGVQDMSTKCS